MKRGARIGLVLGGFFLASAMVGEGCSFNPFVIELGEPSGGGNGAEAIGGGGIGASCDCPPDDKECTSDQCVNGACVHTPLPRGTLCTGGICDENGTCQECLTCSAPGCAPRCPGITCGNDDHCMVGDVCDQEDKRCCDNACMGPCKVCDYSGLEGTCVNLPRGLQVDQCNGSNACDGIGACQLLNMELPLGAACASDAECLSAQCEVGSCRTANNGLCTDHLECASNSCDPATHTCKACTSNGDCPEGSACNTGNGQCKSWLGAPCSTNSDCIDGFCAQNLCGLPLAAACTDHSQCASHNCKGGQCATCVLGGSDCAAGTQCYPSSSLGYDICRLAPGNLCIHDNTCSNICAGFPPRCQ